MRTDALGLMRDGASEAEAAMRAGHPSSAQPGPTARSQGLMDRDMGDKANLARPSSTGAIRLWRAGRRRERRRGAATTSCRRHNQDNREHDRSTATTTTSSKAASSPPPKFSPAAAPSAWHNDHSRPENPLTRTLANLPRHAQPSSTVDRRP
jgi:cobaltochelatase CobN